MGDYTETFRLRLDLGDIGGAAKIVETEVARIRALVAQTTVAPGTSAIPAAAARAEAVSAVPSVQQSAQQLAAAAASSATAAATVPLVGKVQTEVAALAAAVAALEALPPAVNEAARVAARVRAAAAAAAADVGSGGGAAVPDALVEAAAAKVQQATALEAANREELVAVTAQRVEAEQSIRRIESEVESQARIEIAERTRQVPVGLSTAADTKNADLAELEAADRGALVATVRSRIVAEEKIRVIQTQVEAQARAEIATASGVPRSTVPVDVSSATTAKLEQASALEAADRGELVDAVGKRLVAEGQISAIQAQVEVAAQLEATTRSEIVAALQLKLTAEADERSTIATERAEALELVNQEQLVAATSQRVAAERRIALVQEKVEAEARAQATGIGASVPQKISTATLARTEELAGLENASRAELVAAVRQRLAAEEKIRVIEEDVEHQARADLGAQRAAGGGTSQTAGLIQRIQAYVGGGQKPAEDYKSLSQILTSRLLTSGTFAVSGFAAFEAVRTIKGMVEEAQRAQLVFGQMRAEFDALGQADQFPRFRDEVLGFARELGIAADQAAAVGLTMKGAFADTTQAIAATHEALVAITVGGLNQEEVRNLFVAIPKAFDLGTGEIKGMNDELLHLQDVFGVTEKEIASGVGNIAPLAKELGLSFKETSTIIAAATAASGRSAQQVASEIGRATTQIQKNAPAILQIFDTPQASPRLPAVQAALATGDTGQVLVQTFRAWNDLNEAQKNAFLTMVGGRREAASLAAALGESSRIVRELDDNSSHAGRSASALAEYQKTLAAAIREAQEAFKQLGQQLLRLGLGALFSDIIKFGGAVFGVLGTLIGALASLNDVLGGALGRFLEFSLALVAINRISRITFVTELLGQLPQLIRYLVGLPALIKSVGLAQSAANVAGGLGGIFGRGASAGAAITEGPGAAIPSFLLPAAAAETGIAGTPVAAGPLAAVGGPLALAGAAAGALMLAEFQREKTNVAKRVTEITAQYQKLSDEAIVQAIKSEGNKPVADRGPLQAFGSNQVVPGEGIGSQAASLLGDLATAAGVNVLHDVGQVSNLVHGRIGDFAKGLPVVSFFTHPGDKRRKDILQEIQRSRIVETEQDQIKALLDANFLKPEDYDAIQADLQKPGDKGNFKDLQARIKRLSATPQGAAAVQKAKDAKALADQQTRIYGDLGLTATAGVETLDDLKQSYADGNISITQYVDALQKQLGELQPIINTGGAGVEILKAAAQLHAAIDAAIDDEAKQQAEIATTLSTLGGENPAAGKLHAAIAHYKDPRLDNKGRAAAFKDVVSAEQEQFTYILSQADTVDKIDKIIRDGVPLDPGVKAALLREKTVAPVTGSDEWRKIADDTAGALHASGVSIEDIINAAVAGNESVKTASKQVIEQQIAEINKVLPSIKNPAARQDLETQLVALQKLLGETQAAPDVSAPDAHALDQANKLQLAQAKNSVTAAQEQLAKSKAVGDPVSQARLDLAEAKAELTELDRDGVDHASAAYAQAEQKIQDAENNLRSSTQRIKQLRTQLAQSQTDDPVTQAGDALSQAYDDLANAQGPEQIISAQIAVNTAKKNVRDTNAAQVQAFDNYRKVLDEGSPVQAALDGVAAARAAVAAAGDNKTAWANAQAQLVAAQRAVGQAQLEMFDAQLDVNKAIAEAAGDSIGSARIEVQRAQAALQAALANNDAKGALAAQAQLINSQHALEQSVVSETEDRIRFQLDMNEITKAQAIAELQGMLATVKDEHERRQILEEIKQLQDEAGKDLQFDLPTALGLPTLYQARRLTQGGVQDNRNVEITYYAYNQADHNQNVQELAQVVSGPAATGTYGRRY